MAARGRKADLGVDVKKDECITCGATVGIVGKWCDLCWYTLKAKVLEKWVCSKCGAASDKHGNRVCDCEV